MKLRFADFEVTRHWWFCIMYDIPDGADANRYLPESEKEKMFKVESSDDDARNTLMKYWLDPNYCIVGYNIKNYDAMIANAIYQGFTPEQVWAVNDCIIHPENKYMDGLHLRVSSFANKRLKGLVYQDLLDDTKGGSLKEKECILGLSVLESSVSFDQEYYSDEEKAEMIYYCTHDVYSLAYLYCYIGKYYVSTKLAVGEEFGIPEKDLYTSTNAGLVTKVLNAKKRTFTDMDDERIELPDKVRDYVYENLPTSVIEYVLTHRDKLDVRLFDNDVTFGNGGIHSQYGKGLYLEEDDEFMVMNNDASSFYPASLIQFNLLSRCVDDTSKVKSIYDERLAIKHKPDKTEADNRRQLAMKLVLNTMFGAGGNKYLTMYDPYNCSKLCRVDQLILAALANKMHKNIPGLKMIQTNTDATMLYLPRRYYDDAMKLANEWTEITGIPMEQDYIHRIWMRDINNYLMLKTDGSVKRKGTWLIDVREKPGYAILAPLTGFVSTKAAQEFLLHGTDIGEYIFSDKDIVDFAITCTKGPTFKGCVQRFSDGREEDIYNCNRVLATKDENAGQIYKYKNTKQADGTTVRSYYKMPNIPEHCMLVNDTLEHYNFDKIRRTDLDYMFYIERAMEILDIPWMQVTPDGLYRTHQFDII